MPVIQHEFEEALDTSNTWLVRLRHESLELSQRVVKLNQFLGTVPFQALTYRDQDLLSRQYQAMNAYLFILRERIMLAGVGSGVGK